MYARMHTCISMWGARNSKCSPGKHPYRIGKIGTSLDYFRVSLPSLLLESLEVLRGKPLDNPDVHVESHIYGVVIINVSADGRTCFFRELKGPCRQSIHPGPIHTCPSPNQPAANPI